MTTKQAPTRTNKCRYMGCGRQNKSKYGLCCTHYKKQRKRLKDGTVESISEYPKHLYVNHSKNDT